jgi:hypothetical protein
MSLEKLIFPKVASGGITKKGYATIAFLEIFFFE